MSVTDDKIKEILNKVKLKYNLTSEQPTDMIQGVEVEAERPMWQKAYNLAENIEQPINKAQEFVTGRLQENAQLKMPGAKRGLKPKERDVLIDIVAGLPFNIIKAPLEKVKSLALSERESIAHHEMVKNFLTKKGQEAGKIALETRTKMRKEGLEPEAIPFEAVLDLFAIGEITQSLYNKQYAKNLIKEIYTTKKITPKQYADMIKKQRNKIIGKQYPSSDVYREANEQAMKHIDDVFKEYKLTTQHTNDGGLKIMYPKTTTTTGAFPEYVSPGAQDKAARIAKEEGYTGMSLEEFRKPTYQRAGITIPEPQVKPPVVSEEVSFQTPYLEELQARAGDYLTAKDFIRSRKDFVEENALTLPGTGTTEQRMTQMWEKSVPTFARPLNVFRDFLKREEQKIATVVETQETYKDLGQNKTWDDVTNELNAGVNVLKAYESFKEFYTQNIGQPVYDNLGKIVPGFVKKVFDPYYGWNEYVKSLYRTQMYDEIAKRADVMFVYEGMSELDNDELLAVYHLAQRKFVPMTEKFTPVESGKLTYKFKSTSTTVTGKSTTGKWMEPYEYRGKVTQRAARIAQKVSEMFHDLGQQAVQNGIISEETFRKRAWEYIPRMYELHKRAKGDRVRFNNLLKTDMKRWYKRDDRLDATWRKAAGEIKNIKELFIKGTFQEIHDITMAQFQTRLANLPPEMTGGAKVVISEDELHKLPLQYRTYTGASKTKRIGNINAEIQPVGFYNYVKIPVSKQYGALSDQYVREDVYDDIKGMFMRPGDEPELMKLYRKMLTLWKITRTVYSTGAQGRNFTFGVLQCDAGDGWNMKTIKDFITALRTKNDLYKELKTSGIRGSGINDQELVGYLSNCSKGGDSNFMSVVNSMMDMAVKYTGGRQLGKLYGMSDDLFRSLIYISQRNKGASIAEARDLANFYMVNYREVSKTVHWLRGTGGTSSFGAAPFATFHVGILPSLIHTAVVKPWKFAKWYVLLSLLGSKGLDEARNRVELAKAKKRAMRSETKSIIPNVPYSRTWWETNNKAEDILLDLTYNIPFLELGVEFKQQVENEIEPVSPLVTGVGIGTKFFSNPGLRTLAEIGIFRKDAFTGEEFNTVESVADYAYRTIMPSLAPEIPGTGIKGGWGYQGIKKAVEGKPVTKKGQERGVLEALFRYGVGIKTVRVNYIHELENRRSYAMARISELKKEVGKLAGDARKTQKEKDQIKKDNIKEIKRLTEIVKQYNTDLKTIRRELGINEKLKGTDTGDTPETNDRINETLQNVKNRWGL